MTVEEPSSPQQKSPSQIIELGGFNPEGTELAVLHIKVKEEIIAEVADEVLEDQGLEVQAPIKVESKSKEVAHVADKGGKIISTAFAMSTNNF